MEPFREGRREGQQNREYFFQKKLQQNNSHRTLTKQLYLVFVCILETFFTYICRYFLTHFVLINYLTGRGQGGSTERDRNTHNILTYLLILYVIFFADPKIKASLRKHLLSHGDSDMAAVHKGGGGGGLGNSTALTNTVYAHQRPEPAIHQASHAGTNGSYPEQEPLLSSSSGGSNNRLVVVDDEERLQWEPLLANNSPDQKAKGQPKFEAFTMTGEYIINISRTQQSLIPKQQKKVSRRTP